MEFINNTFKFVTALSPILILLVYIAQLRAMEKQNNQNLHKLRLNCFIKFFALIADIEELMLISAGLFPVKEETESCLKAIDVKQKELIIMISEIQLLFETDIFNTFNRIISLIKTTIDDFYSIISKKDFDKKTIWNIYQKMHSEIENYKIIDLFKDQIKLK